MKLLHPNLNILDIRWDGRDNTKEQCRCISFVVSSKTERLGKKSENNIKDIIGISIACCVFIGTT